MSNIPVTDPVVRIPNLPSGRMVDENGMPTEEELTFRQALLTLLQDLFGPEGLVMPAQNQANVTAIQNNQAQAQGASDSLVYTCQFGTFLYIPSTSSDPTMPNDSVVVSMQNGVDGAPLFKTVTVT